MQMRKRSSMAVGNSNTTRFTTSRRLLGFSAKLSSDTDPSVNPTSILESRIFSPTVNPFFSDTKPRSTWHSAKSRAVGLGIVDALQNEKPEIQKNCDNPDSRMVLFGSQLKIQTPYMQPTSEYTAGRAEYPGLPIEFGAKNKNSQLALLSPAPRSPMATSADMWAPSTAMELSEDYTCVIAHGPNPRTTHIFANCIVESCSTSHNSVSSPRGKGSFGGDSVSFLPFCHVCKKSLGQGKDILMYRGVQR